MYRVTVCQRLASVRALPMDAPQRFANGHSSNVTLVGVWALIWVWLGGVGIWAVCGQFILWSCLFMFLFVFCRAIVLTYQEHLGVTYITLNEDPSPRMLIHNKCPIPLLLKENVKGRKGESRLNSPVSPSHFVPSSSTALLSSFTIYTSIFYSYLQ